MRKTRVALSVATSITAALGSVSMAEAAEVFNEDGTVLNIYGNLQLAITSIETANDDGSTEAEVQLLDNGSTIGFSGEHVINSALSGYFVFEVEADVDEIKDGNGIDTGDQAYLGLKGDFGDARIGSWDPLIDDWIQDPISNNEFFDVTDSNSAFGGDDGVNTQGESLAEREGDKVQYQSPSLAGLVLAIGAQIKGDAEEENVDDSTSVAVFAGAEYTIGPISAAFVYDSLDNFDGDVTGVQFLDADGAVAGDFDAGDQFGLKLEYEVDDLRTAFKYERYESGDDDILPDQDRIALGARYGYGMGDVYGSYQFVSVDSTATTDDDDRNEVLGGMTYNLSSSLYTWVEAAFYDREDDVDNGVAVGVVLSF